MVAFFEDVHRVRGEVAGTVGPGSPAARERGEVDGSLRGWIDDLNVGGCALRLTVAEEYPRLSVVASEEVYDLFGAWKADVNAFNRLLWDARIAHRAAEHTDSPETPRTILSRLRAGEKADAVTAGFVELRGLIRREMGR